MFIVLILPACKWLLPFAADAEIKYTRGWYCRGVQRRVLPTCTSATVAHGASQQLNSATVATTAETSATNSTAVYRQLYFLIRTHCTRAAPLCTYTCSRVLPEQRACVCLSVCVCLRLSVSVSTGASVGHNPELCKHG